MAADNTFRLGHSRFSTSTEGLQRILEGAYDKKARPLCQCSRQEPAMYIAKVGNEYILKRMPGTGHLHDPVCETFDPPPELSGLGQVNGQAIVTDEAGGTMLKLDFPLSVKGGRAAPVADPGEAASSAVASPAKLRLLAMLHYLWEAAGLNRWRNSFGRRRSWFIIHRELMAAAAKVSTKAGPISGNLFVPPLYTIEEKERLAADRRRFLHRLQPVAGKPTPLGIVIAEYKGYEPSTYGRKLILKHLPDYPMFLDEETGKRFDRIAADKIETIEATPNSHLIVIATFSPKPSHGNIREIAVMPVNGQWIPFDHDREHQLLDALAERDFIKCLKYNLSATAPVANALLLDTGTPVAMFAPNHDLGEEEFTALQKIAADGVYPPWLWAPEEFDLPGIPGKSK